MNAILLGYMYAEVFQRLWPYVRQQIRAELILLITHHSLCKSRADVQAAGRECRLIQFYKLT